MPVYRNMEVMLRDLISFMRSVPLDLNIVPTEDRDAHTVGYILMNAAVCPYYGPDDNLDDRYIISWMIPIAYVQEWDEASQQRFLTRDGREQLLQRLRGNAQAGLMSHWDMAPIRQMSEAEARARRPGYKWPENPEAPTRYERLLKDEGNGPTSRNSEERDPNPGSQ